MRDERAYTAQGWRVLGRDLGLDDPDVDVIIRDGDVAIAREQLHDGIL
jgi:hypothetical protein